MYLKLVYVNIVYFTPLENEFSINGNKTIHQLEIFDPINHHVNFRHLSCHGFRILYRNLCGFLTYSETWSCWFICQKWKYGSQEHDT